MPECAGRDHRRAARSAEGWEGLAGIGRLAAAAGTRIAVFALTAFLCTAAHARAAAPLPPDLVALEQQTAQLHVESERFSFQEELALSSLGSLLGAETPLVLIVAGEGEASDSPPESTAVGGLLGLPEERILTVGETVYRYRPQVASFDGHRPWVRGQRTAKEGSGLDPGGQLEDDETGAQGTFSKLIEQLDSALSVEESGPATVDDQRVIEFDAKLDPTPYLAQLKSESKEPQHPLSSPLETSPVRSRKAPAKPASPPTLELEVFIAPNGLPVRSRYTFSDEGVTVAVRVDTLAINIPVHVTPPPAKQTIGEAQLERVERRRAERQREQALRACRHLHGARAKACRATVRAESRVPSAGASPL